MPNAQAYIPPDSFSPEDDAALPAQDHDEAGPPSPPPSGRGRAADGGADLSVGEILRRERLRYGKTLEDVEAMLRIRVAYLQAIEQGDHARLPGRVYAIGFVRSYAEYLGLDGARIISLFKRQAASGGTGFSPELNFPVPASENRAASPWLFASAALLALCAGAAWVVMSRPALAPLNEIPEIPLETRIDIAPPLVAAQPAAAPTVQPQAALPAAGGEDPRAMEEAIRLQIARIDPTIAVEPVETAAEEAAAGVPESTEGVQEITATPSSATAPETAAAAAPAGAAGHRLVLKATESTWVEIRDAQGAALLSSILKAGDLYFVPDQPGLQLSTGNAGGFEIEIDGKPAGKLGETGDVRRDVTLDPEALGALLLRPTP